MPLLSRDVLNDRLSAVSILKSDHIYVKFNDYLLKICDIERILTRVEFNSVTPIELKRLQVSLDSISKIKKILSELKLNSLLNDIFLNMDIFTSLSNFISEILLEHPASNFKEEGVIKDKFDFMLDKYRNIVNNTGKFILAYQNEERVKTKISKLKVSSGRNGGYYINLSNKINKLPEDYQKIKLLTNSTRYITNGLRKLELDVMNSKKNAFTRARRLYNVVIYRVKKNRNAIKNVAEYIAILDILVAFARQSSMYNWCRPVMVDDFKIDISSGRHPVIESKSLNSFVPNDLLLDKNNRIFIITGANMGGKSTYMRQTAIIVLLAHIGSHVPAKKAVIGKIDKIFTRIGAGDDLVNAQSTFMLEMTEVSNILNRATDRSLVLIDEIGRGTNYLEGESLAWSVLLEFIDVKKSFVLFSTHFHNLSNVSKIYSHVKCIRFKVLEINCKLIFFYKCESGVSNQSFGIYIAKLAGLSDNIIKNANKYLSDLNNEHGCYIKQSDMVKFKEFSEHFSKINPDLLSPKIALDKLYFLKLLFEREDK